MVTEILYKCSNCGKDTDWDDALGTMPLCVECWDLQVDYTNLKAAYKRKYDQEHREELAAYQRKYYQEHREEKAAYKRKYDQEHREMEVLIT